MVKKVQNKNGYAWLADGYIDGRRTKRRFRSRADAELFAAHNSINRKAPIQNGFANPFRLSGVPYEYDAALVNKSLVYFIQDGNGFIKIGFSTNFLARFNDINVAVSSHLTILGVIFGTHKREKEIHRQFSHLRIKGEWFRVTEELLSFIRMTTQSAPIWPLISIAS
jgi:hypothetical protein